MHVPVAFRALIAPLAIALGLVIGLPLGPQPAPTSAATPASEPGAAVAGGALAIQLPGSPALTLDMETLRSLRRTEFTTTTIWTSGRHSFAGVALSDLLAHLGRQASAVRATALNDYAALIPAADLRPGHGPIIAYEMDGAPLPRRGFGPLWIIYPFDASAAFRTESVYARSVSHTA
ncbi:Oxidoreductase molybdopterin binding domain protein [Pseudoruegeria aquimaris]|uniref:Oxidoreductase molybdopterin binding domain protein n=1 Tax=Pseudoruegeria aquimaris TaxID=393663 RepID=A0A1Y5TNP9_9RHOB|nr:molybdopterin-dependent oxidoreductase [Pseudoruegeria aquimaris]SLN67959.1 Oxidoreductase molybdopterin binding domain protein [Pseudoruegeria aquimaris]